jgi:DNA-binding CsgD family transcriptional regulator
MELIERAGFLASLQTEFQRMAAGEGHCIFVSGEAGIGKTSLVKAFCKELKNRCNIYQGSCDALFTPRPLAPLYDILLQMRNDLPEPGSEGTDRTVFFTRFIQELNNQKDACLIVFEDIHWADEATLDFIKFLARRITQLRCLFILTYRGEEIHSNHPLRNLLGQLNPDSFTRLQLPPLSRQAVEKLAGEKGYNGEDVYSISGGNPFYVNEILASYSTGVPDNIKDSILSVYNRNDGITKQIWEILSVLPTGFEVKYLERLEPSYAAALEKCLDLRILVPKEGLISFKHELYRRTIESSLSPLLRVALNKKILDLLLEDFEENLETERIIHHAKNANEYDLVVHYAPLAARQAASLGAHEEARKLYYSAIEYYQGNDKDRLIQFYEPYAYECYLTNRGREAIIYQERSLKILKEKNDPERIGNCLWFLSRLWWFDGNRKHAEKYAGEAIAVLADQAPSRVKAMAFSNMSQLNMLAGQTVECISWGEKAIAMARELNDEETLSHALNNVGCVKNKIRSSQQEGHDLLQQSLEIALRNSYHEHAARAYANQLHNAIETKDYPLAKKIVAEGICYCDERDLNSWACYMQSCESRLKLETGHWSDAARIGDNLLQYEDQARIVKMVALVVVATIKMRKGEPDALPLLLEAKEKALKAMELQRIIPAMVALLEYEWITGEPLIEKGVLDTTLIMIGQMGQIYETNEFAFWLSKARRQSIPQKEVFEGYETDTVKKAQKAAAWWERAGCPYLQALALFEGEEEDKRKAITIVHGLGARAVYEKMKLEMRGSGIKSIPRGIRRTTQSNPALLTDRELGVLQLLKEGIQNKEIAARLFISAKTVDHHISAILFKLEAKSRIIAVQEAIRLEIIK